MKKRLVILIGALLLMAGMLAGCGQTDDTAGTDENVVKCLVNSSPHEMILKQAIPELEAQGITLEIVSDEWDSTWMEQVNNGDVDLMFDTFVPYLDEWNTLSGGNLAALGGTSGAIHIEPIQMMSEKYKSIKKLPKKAKIAIVDDALNEYRCLKLLEKEGYVKLSSEMTFANASLDMIDKYVKPIEITELEVDTLIANRAEYDAYITSVRSLVNAKVDVPKPIAEEEGQEYANVIAVKGSNVTDEKLMKVLRAIQTDDNRKWMKKKYKGAVVPAF